jgi:glycerophosphoryl diester phosphodiesterase
MIFGVLTETNQFVKIHPKIEASTVDDDLEAAVSSSYIGAETSRREPDLERVRTIRNIKLESQFYSTFRSTIRTLMSYYENKACKINILNIIKDGGKHTDILKEIEEELRRVVKEAVVFNEYSPEQVDGLSEISSCISNCKDKSHCSHDEETCLFQLMIPKQNLVTQVDNERLYYGRLSDELARFKRIRAIMMEPIQYLNLSNISFKVNDDEILLLDSAMNSGYFNDVNVFNVSEYIKNITFDMARPDSAIKYANVDELK